jgi:hypothetical protein
MASKLSQLLLMFPESGLIYLESLTKLKELNQQFLLPSARKFKAVEEATAAITEIIARDVNQGQDQDTVKKIASLRLNLTIPR